jgi:hypothetical protein
MTPDQTQRLRLLQGEWAPSSLVRQLYGLDPEDGAVMGRVRSWATRLSAARALERPGAVNRYVLETFFQVAGLMPLAWAAARLGMDTVSFEKALAALVRKQEIDSRYIDENGDAPRLIEASLIKTFYALFPALQSRIFSDHDDFCARLHKELRGSYGVDVQPIKCVTSVRLVGEKKADFAHEFDVITLEPIGIRYQVWLDFHKPLNLRPDACSMLLYSRERRALRPFLLGEEPVLPSGLRRR